MLPAWLLKLLSVGLTGFGLAGFSGYVLGHVKPPTAPLHPKVVTELIVLPAPEASAAPTGAGEEPAPAPTPVVIVKVVKVQVPNPAASSSQPTVSLSSWLSQTNVPQATTTYSS